MIIKSQEYNVKNITYIIRSAIESDAAYLSGLRVQIDGETENLDREQGEAFIDEEGFKQIINTDSLSPKNLFLVAVLNNKIIGYSRCEGIPLKRFSHKVEFGVCVLKEYWGFSVGKNFLLTSVLWADANDIKKITLNVLETNEKAINLYKKFGFEIEGVLKKDKLLSDGNYYNIIVMGRLKF